ncbi:MAG: hypothetical protein IKI69_05375 [Oscillospiraceae bacterium]|nr:hypothetical protein [Oscillospiraceae bacterium]
MEDLREQLNRLYRLLDEKAHEYIAEMTQLRGSFKIESGFYNGHYHKNAEGNYQLDSYPIPVISVKGLCDIEIDFDENSITSKLSKELIMSFDWNILGTVKFEVYGVDDYLRDYGDNQSICEISKVVQNSTEKEFFISFYIPVSESGENVLKFLRKLQENGFYY